MKAINNGTYKVNRSTDFINTLMNTMIENGEKIPGLNMRGSSITDKYIFGQWIMEVTGNIKLVPDHTTVIVALRNTATYELYRFITTINRTNKNCTAPSSYTLNPCKA